MHLVDTMVYIAGRVTEVHCVATHRAVAKGDDTTTLLLRFASGVTGLAFCSTAAARNYRLAVYGSRGFAEILRPTMDTFHFIPAVQGRASHQAAIPEPETIDMPHVNSVTVELEEFARCVDERREPDAGRRHPARRRDIRGGRGVCAYRIAGGGRGLALRC